MAHVALIAGLAASLVNFRGDLIRALRERGHRVSALAPAIPADVAARLTAWGAEVHEYPLQRAGLNPLSDLRTRRHLGRLLARLECTHTLAYTIKPVIYGSLAAQAAGVPRRFAMITGLGTAFEAGGLSGRLMRGVAEGLYRKALSGCEGVFFQNTDDRDLFIDRGLVAADRCTLVDGSGVHLDRYAPTPPPEGPPRILCIARLLADKGIREFAAAARTVRRAVPAAQFVLVGFHEDHPRGIPRDEVAAWEAEGLLTFTGPLLDVRPELAACTVYCLPSYREGLPRTVLEAMSVGRAIVTTDVPGCRETVVAGRNGVLVPRGDAAALAAALLEYCNDPQRCRREGIASREIAAERFDVARVNQAILQRMSL